MGGFLSPISPPIICGDLALPEDATSRCPPLSSSSWPRAASYTRGEPGRGAVLSPSHLFPIDVACCYGDHGGFSHKPREEGAHAQGGSVYPGNENAKGICLLEPRGSTGNQHPEKV